MSNEIHNRWPQFVRDLKKKKIYIYLRSKRKKLNVFIIFLFLTFIPYRHWTNNHAMSLVTMSSIEYCRHSNWHEFYKHSHIDVSKVE